MKAIYAGMLRRYLRLNIRTKMLLAYLPLIVLIIVLSAAHVMRLERIMAINEEILERDIPTAEAAGRMIDSLLSQELYANRFFILGSAEMREAFSLQGAEFKESLALLKEKAPPAIAPRAEPLGPLHARYESFFVEEFTSHRAAPADQAGFRERVRELQDEIIDQLKGIENQARKLQEGRTRRMSEMQRDTFRLMLALSSLGVLVGAGAALLITRDIASSIGRLRAATSQLAEGRFDELPNLRGQDELGELSWSFYEMGQKLKALEEMKLDSSPLTHLPGGLAIENALRARVEHAAPFASLSIAVVTDQKAALDSHIKISEIAAALKEYAKTIAGSKFIVDRRAHEAGDLSVTGAKRG